MKNDSILRTRTSQAMGTVMMFSWILILGPLGALLLGGTAYAMLAKNPAVGVACGIVFFFPLLSTAAWGAVRLLELHREKRVRRAEYVFTAEQTHSASQ
jgi:hypothetical protein